MTALNDETQKEHDQHVMVALNVPSALGMVLLGQLQQAGYRTVSPEDLHLTICYIGDIADVPIKLNALEKRLEDGLWEFGKVSGIVNGYGRFDKTHKESQSVVYANYDSSILPDLRQAVAQIVQAAGIPLKRDHGYTPHITLAYLPAETETPHLKLPEIQMDFASVTLYWGKTRIEIPLKGDRIKEKADIPNYRDADDPDTSCASCKHFRETAGDMPSYCREFEANVKPDYTCDDFATGAAEEKKEAGGGITVFKEKSGNYRWVMLSSNAYRDRDGQIVSEKSLAADVERADRDGDYGPLRWWHVPGLDIGTCDFNMMSGRVLVESGTFKNAQIAEAMKEAAPYLSGSIAFRHPLNEPDADGIFHTIRRKERSLLPLGKQSNPFVALVQIGDDSMATFKEKVAAFRELINDKSGDVTRSILDQAAGTEKMAEQLGVAFKESGLGEVDDETLKELANVLEADSEKAKKKAPKKEDMEDEEDEEEDGDEAAADAEDMIDKMMAGKKKEAGDPDASDPLAGVEYIGDMKPADFGNFLGTALQLTVGERLNAIEAKLATTEKEAGDSAVAMKAEITQLKEENAKLKGRLEAQGDTLKELGAELPPALAGFVMGFGASKDPDTVTNKERKGPHADPDKQPEGTPIDAFADDFLFKDTPYAANNGNGGV